MSTPTRALAALALAGLLGCAGCAAKRAPFAAGGTQRLAVVFLADGLDASVLDAMLAAGKLPVIEREFVRGGLRVRHAVDALPAVTYANVVSLLTGVWPGRHGILGNRWFDPRTRLARDYGHAGTFRRVNDDFRTPTIFELLAGEPTAAVQLHTRRGATKIIDFSLANGLDWALGRYDRVNARAAEALPRLDRFARRAGRWPRLVVFYFPGVDELGHRFGPDSPQYRRAVRTVDATIGRVLEGLRRRGLYERSDRVLVSDHGMVATPRSRRFDLTGWLTERTHLRVCALKGPLADPLARQRRLRNADVVVVADAGRRAHVHVLRGNGRTWERANGTPGGQPAAVRQDEATPAGLRAIRSAIFDLHASPAVDLVCLRRRPGCVEVRSRRGTALVQRRPRPGSPAYRVQVLTDRDPWGYDTHPPAAELLDETWHPSRQWLRQTAGSAYPDFVPQIVELFDSPRAGDMIVFAADGWTLRPEGPGSHGGAGRRDRIVPLLLAGPGIRPGGTLDAARTVDLVPTLLKLLHVEPPAGVAFDGVALPVAADR